jgi:hypothetical protein
MSKFIFGGYYAQPNFSQSTGRMETECFKT